VSPTGLSLTGAAPPLLGGLAEIALDYDYFVIDQWGVLHDGHQPLPGARAALEGLRATGRAVALVSNSSKAAGPSRALLRALGFEDALYDAMITAGELGKRHLQAQIGRGRPPRVRCVLAGEGEGAGPDSVVAELGLPCVDDVQQADLLVAAGVSAAHPSASAALLRAAADRCLPLLCLNPDVQSVQPDGSFLWCPGAWAEAYAALGGEVLRFGKPGPEIYAAARADLLAAGQGPLERGLAIGDSLDHDILGAQNNDLDALFISGGLHYPETGAAAWGPPDPARLGALLRARGLWPRFSMGALRW
jgi:HAD superfamily hydrolase (TIGR01459 family)